MTAALPLVAAVLMALAAAVALPESPTSRLPTILPGRRVAARPRASTTWLSRLACTAAAVGIVAVVGGPIGLLLAAAVAALGPWVLGRLESRAARESREHLQRQAPQVADLLASTLASGVPVAPALRAVADAIGAPSRDSLRSVVAALDLGADAEAAWRGCAPELAPIAHAAVRSARTGAPLAVLLRRIADDLARDRRRDVEVAARSAGVRAVAPLATCFLPAFLLVGVVPVVASLAGTLL